MEALLGAYGDADDSSEEEEVQQEEEEKQEGKEDAMNIVSEAESRKRKSSSSSAQTTLPPPPFASDEPTDSSTSSSAKKAKKTILPPVQLPGLDDASNDLPSFAAPTYSAPPPMKLVEPPADYQASAPKRRPTRNAGQFVPPQVRRGRPNVPTEETVSYDDVSKKGKTVKSPAKTI